MTTLSANHPQRLELNDEVHARPPDAVMAQLRVLCLALFIENASKEAVSEPIRRLARRFGSEPPEPASAPTGVFLDTPILTPEPSTMERIEWRYSATRASSNFS